MTFLSYFDFAETGLNNVDARLVAFKFTSVGFLIYLKYSLILFLILFFNAELSHGLRL